MFKLAAWHNIKKICTINYIAQKYSQFPDNKKTKPVSENISVQEVVNETELCST